MDPNQIPQVPASPAAAPGTNMQVDTSPVSPEGAPGLPLSEEEMRANLQDLMSKIQIKKQAFDNTQVAVDDKMRKQHALVMNQLFDFFKSVNVDPSDPDAINDFLEKIKEQNPEFYQQLVKSLEIILGEDERLSKGTTEDQNMSPENMNINQNEQTLPQNL